MWKYLYRVGWIIMVGNIGLQIAQDSTVGMICVMIGWFFALIGAIGMKDN